MLTVIALVVFKNFCSPFHIWIPSYLLFHEYVILWFSSELFLLASLSHFPLARCKSSLGWGWGLFSSHAMVIPLVHWYKSISIILVTVHLCISLCICGSCNIQLLNLFHCWTALLNYIINMAIAVQPKLNSLSTLTNTFKINSLWFIALLSSYIHFGSFHLLLLWTKCYTYVIQSSQPLR